MQMHNVSWFEVLSIVFEKECPVDFVNRGNVLTFFAYRLHILYLSFGSDKRKPEEFRNF